MDILGTIAGAGIVATAVGIGGYSLGIATSDGLRDAPENYSISQQEYTALEKSISSLKTRKSTDAIPEYDRSSLPTDWRDLDGNGCNTREYLICFLRQHYPDSNKNHLARIHKIMEF